MENDSHLTKDTLTIDSLELLLRYLIKCKNDAKKDESRSKFIFSCADILAAVYYYRTYPNINDFIEKYMNDKDNYFQIQWARTTWANLGKLTNAEISNLVIKQISLVDNLEEEQ